MIDLPAFTSWMRAHTPPDTRPQYDRALSGAQSLLGADLDRLIADRGDPDHVHWLCASLVRRIRHKRLIPKAGMAEALTGLLQLGQLPQSEVLRLALHVKRTLSDDSLAARGFTPPQIDALRTAYHAIPTTASVLGDAPRATARLYLTIAEGQPVLGPAASSGTTCRDAATLRISNGGVVLRLTLGTRLADLPQPTLKGAILAAQPPASPGRPPAPDRLRPHPLHWPILPELAGHVLGFDAHLTSRDEARRTASAPP